MTNTQPSVAPNPTIAPPTTTPTTIPDPSKIIIREPDVLPRPQA